MPPPVWVPLPHRMVSDFHWLTVREGQGRVTILPDLRAHFFMSKLYLSKTQFCGNAGLIVQ